ncbi:EF-hand domain-containing protein [Hyphococcus luteus]|uniref:EF-hand domain-containing protein n=1 Tax=Hyphococcus luteus TaxID=2058213 RepID=A0A2S7JZE0_9PROT|nr:EF-hand domain-containing protein [Marinicaulis flavus]PQA85623.1 hypothetical protein CW354_22080 [Marinicaulis flavus]
MNRQRPPKKTETIEIRLSPDAKQAFMASCEKRKRSASAVIRGFIDLYIAETNRAPQSIPIKEFDMLRLINKNKLRLSALAGCIAAGFALATTSAAADPRVEAVFQWLDADHDEAISKQEFLSPEKTGEASFNGLMIMLTTKGAIPANETRERLFARMDQTKDGMLSLEELSSIVTVETVLNEPVLQADQDGDGKVAEGELAAYITARRAMAGDRSPAAGAALMAHGVIAAHDADKDGAVGPEDFAG